MYLYKHYIGDIEGAAKSISKGMLSYINFSCVCLFVCLFVCLSVSYVFVTMVTQPYISAKNKDDDMNLSGYDPSHQMLPSKTSWITLSSMSLVRNPQRPPSNPLLDPHS